MWGRVYETAHAKALRQEGPSGLESGSKGDGG